MQTTTNKVGRRFALAVLGTLAWSTSGRAEIPELDDITPGLHRGIAQHDGDPWNLGYWEYLPAAFDPDDESTRYPLLVWLGGIGQADDSSTCPGDANVCWEAQCDGDGLCRNLRRGPFRLMWEGEWDDLSRPFIVVSPQNPVPPLSTEPWSADELDAFFDFVTDSYPIDSRRTYLMGMSQGGRGVLEYTAAHPRRFTAVAPMPGGAVSAPDVTCAFGDTALWVFHGENDSNGALGSGVFAPCWMARAVDMYNDPASYLEFTSCAGRIDQPFPSARMTMFYGVGHNAFLYGADPQGFGFLQPAWAEDNGCNFEEDLYRVYAPELDEDGVYSWFLALDRPAVSAPTDVVVFPAAGGVTISATVDDDDSVVFEWTQIGGAPLTMVGETSADLTLWGLEAGRTYTFEVMVVDADEQWDRAEVAVTAIDGTGEGSSGGPASSTGSVGGGEGGTSGRPGATDSGMGTSNGADEGSSGGTSSTSGSSPAAPMPQSAGLGTVDQGCACSSGSSAPRWAALLLLSLLGIRRRRRV